VSWLGRVRWRTIAFAVVGIAIAIALPRVLYSALALRILLWALFAVSVDLLLGYGGMLSFGHAAFWGGGGYAAALLAKTYELPFPIAALGGTLVAMALAAPIGFREILLFGGSALLSVGAWLVYPPAGFIVPGAILVYVSVFGTS